jgi:hypothetical protein
MSQGRTGKINYRCPNCMFRDIDYDLLYDKEADEFYCRRCNWEGGEHEILQLYSDFKKKYKAMLKRYTVEYLSKDD